MGRVYQAEGTAHAECLEAKQSRSYPATSKAGKFDEARFQESPREKADQRGIRRPESLAEAGREDLSY